MLKCSGRSPSHVVLYIYIYIYILFFQQCWTRCHNVLSFSHVVQIVYILYRSDENIFFAIYLVYNTWTCAVITSFLVSEFRVPILLLLLLLLLLLVIAFMRGSYNYVPGKSDVSRLYNFSAVVYQQFLQQTIIYYYYYYNHRQQNHFQFLKTCALMEWSKSNCIVVIIYLILYFHFIILCRQFQQFLKKSIAYINYYCRCHHYKYYR
jgi:hypothetical protein